MASRIPGLGADAAVSIKAAILLAILGIDAQAAIDEYLKTGKLQFDLIPEWLAGAISGPLAEAERTIGEPLFELLIRAPSGVDLSAAPGHQEADAVRMVQRMMGFAFALPWGVAQLKQVLQAATGGNAPKAVIEALEKLPEDLGINWALGTTMANIFELSTGRPLAEAIAEQTRPFRFEWPQIRALLRQGHILEAQAVERFHKIGIRDEDIPLALQLDRVLLTFSDLQQAYEFGLMDEGAVRAYAERLGLRAEDIDVLINLYLHRSQTAGGSMLRSVAQRGYLEDHLSEAQYRELLTQAHVPPDSIELEVEAANLTKDWGRLALSVAEVKALHQAGRMDDHAALGHLVSLGYTENDGQLLINSWHAAVKAGKLGLSEARILGYLLGGVLTRQEAFDHLVGLGYKADDAAFLADNPAAFGGAFKYPLAPRTVAAALRSGDIEEAKARELLRGLGVAPDEADLLVKVALAGTRRAHKPKAPAKALGEAQVLEALKLGLAEPSWALSELALLGYSDADAQLLVALEQAKLTGQVPTGWTVLN